MEFKHLKTIELLDYLEEILLDGIRLPFSSSRLVDEQEAYDNLLFSMNTQPYVANSKLQQITWLDQVLSLSKQERDEFATDMIFIAKKEGSRYGPFAKIF